MKYIHTHNWTLNKYAAKKKQNKKKLKCRKKREKRNHILHTSYLMRIHQMMDIFKTHTEKYPVAAAIYLFSIITIEQMNDANCH